MEKRLHRLERQLEELIEGSLSRLLGGSISPERIAAEFARAMIDAMRSDERGKLFAPDQFVLTLHPDDGSNLYKLGSKLREDLIESILEAVREREFHMAFKPNITIAFDPGLPERGIRVIAWHSDRPLDLTHAMPREEKTESETLPEGAFLVISGDRHFSLDCPVINIGRRLDNQLILDNPHISRTHAQIRVRDGRFVIFDLGSTLGTKVNNRRVNQHILLPGDVIRFADVEMVYGEDERTVSDETRSYDPPFPPRPAGDQRTQVIKGDSET
jgi:hypothetical protein